MSLTAAEKVSIRRHLGYNSAAESNYPWLDVFRTLSQVLESVVADQEQEVRAILTRLANLETALDAAPGRFKVNAIGSIDLRPEEPDQLWREVRRWRRELSIVLGVPLARSGTEIRVV